MTHPHTHPGYRDLRTPEEIMTEDAIITACLVAVFVGQLVYRLVITAKRKDALSDVGNDSAPVAAVHCHCSGVRSAAMAHQESAPRNPEVRDHNQQDHDGGSVAATEASE
jgi:hypothetical protein